MYPSRVTRTTTSVSGIRSSSVRAVNSGTICVRRASPYVSLSSFSSSPMSRSSSFGEARTSLRRLISASFSAASVWTVSRSSAVEPGEAHVEDRLRLLAREEELSHQRLFGGRDVAGPPDDLDHLVDVVDRGEEPLEDVEPLRRLPEVELRPLRDRAAAVGEVGLEEALERQHPRLAVDDAEIDHAEARLERRVLEDPVEDDLRLGVAPELEHDGCAVPVGLVPQVADAVELLRLDELGDLRVAGPPCSPCRGSR